MRSPPANQASGVGARVREFPIVHIVSFRRSGGRRSGAARAGPRGWRPRLRSSPRSLEDHVAWPPPALLAIAVTGLPPANAGAPAVLLECIRDPAGSPWRGPTTP